MPDSKSSDHRKPHNMLPVNSTESKKAGVDIIHSKIEKDSSVFSKETEPCEHVTPENSQIRTENSSAGGPVQTVGPSDVLDDSIPPHPDSLVDLAVLVERYAARSCELNLDEAIFLGRRFLNEIMHPPHPHRIECLMQLGSDLLTRFQQENREHDLNEFISLRKEALELTTPPNDYGFQCLMDLGSSMMTKYRLERRRSDLDDALNFSKEAVGLLPPRHAHRYTPLTNIGLGLTAKFQEDGRQEDLDDAVRYSKEALDVWTEGSPHRSISLINLAGALMLRFKERGDEQDGDKSIMYFKEALALDLPPYNRYQSLIGLADVLAHRFSKQGRPPDLDDAISSLQNARLILPSTHGQALHLLTDLGNLLTKRYRREGSSKDIDDAIRILRAVALDHGPLQPERLSDLAGAFSVKFKQGGRQEDLDEAFIWNKQALELWGPDAPDRFVTLHNIAEVLSDRFMERGHLPDLEESISSVRMALKIMPSHYPNRANCLINLGNSLTVRYKQENHQRDLNEAIEVSQQALSLLPQPHPDRSMALNNLAIALIARFTRQRQHSDIDEATMLHREALSLRAHPHPRQSNSLVNLAMGLSARFGETHNPADRNESISLLMQALDLLPPSHPERSICLNNLSNALAGRFLETQQMHDLQEAIARQREALSLQPQTYSRQSLYFENLGKRYLMLYEYLKNPADLEKAMESFASALQCPSQSPSQRLDVAITWSFYADRHQHSSALKAYGAALEVLPRLASFGLDIQSRQQALTADGRVDGLARRAARCAIQHGQLDKAIEYLETGRAIFWAQVLKLRSPLDELRERGEHELVDELNRIAAALEIGSYRDSGLETEVGIDSRIASEAQETKYKRLNEEWDTVLEKVRRLSGFEEFLRPRRIASLQVAAAESPLVFLVPNDERSDFLIMTSTGVDHVPRSNMLSTSVLRELVASIRVASSSEGRALIEETPDDPAVSPPVVNEALNNDIGEERHARYYESHRGKPVNDVFKDVLATLWVEVVKPILDHLGIEKSNSRPMLQWCPTGLFSFLPIHAAGLYDSPKVSVDCVSEYVISTHTPAIEVLLSSSAGIEPSVYAQEFKMLTVADTKRLFATQAELKMIESRVPKNCSLIKLGVYNGRPALVETICDHLLTASIVHFACHGTQHRTQPLNSALLVDDGGELMISRIMKQKLPNGSLAFLAACETAMGDANSPDEAMSIGASLIFAGFRSVAATMWRMADADGPTIADAFYENLFQVAEAPAQQSGISRSARAFDIAVKKIRDNGASFRRWVPFIHMGK